jgi:hypothetical protein
VAAEDVDDGADPKDEEQRHDDDDQDAHAETLSRTLPECREVRTIRRSRVEVAHPFRGRGPPVAARG